MVQDPKPSHRFARRGLLAAGAIGVAIGMLTWTATRPPRPDGTGTLDVTEAMALARAGRITLIDIRRPEEWAATGLASPAHPLDMRRADFIARLAEITEPGTPVALICARGVRSARLTRDLGAAGVTDVIDVPEGMIGSSAGPGWIARGLPLKPYEGEH